jgi:hypothetical protein
VARVGDSADEMDQARRQEHPSHQILERIERTIIDRRDAEEYVDLLLSKVEQWDHPSLRVLDRASRFVHLIATAELLERAEADQD